MYEALAYIYTDGKGVSFGTIKKLTAMSSNVVFMIAVIVIGIIVMTVLFDHSQFGYRYRALKNGQKVAVNTGIKEVPNAIVCYVIAGGLMGVQGYISGCVSGTIQMALNFGTIGVMFTAFLPMFIGGFIGRFINEHIGMVLGAATSAFISLGFVRLGLSTEVQSLVSALVLVIFLIYLNNEYKILSFFTKQKAEKKGEE